MQLIMIFSSDIDIKMNSDIILIFFTIIPL